MWDMMIIIGGCCASIILEDLMYKRLKWEVPFFYLVIFFIKEPLLVLHRLDVLLWIEGRAGSTLPPSTCSISASLWEDKVACSWDVESLPLAVIYLVKGTVVDNRSSPSDTATSCYGRVANIYVHVFMHLWWRNAELCGWWWCSFAKIKGSSRHN